MRTVLVTGGAGFVGSQTCKHLAHAGYIPITYDDLSRGHRWAVRWGPFELGDIADAGRLADVLRRYQPCAVLHFAGFAYVGESMDSPQLYYGNNVAATARMLETLRGAAVRNVVFSSSCATYGGDHASPIDETAEQRPLSVYAFSKLVVERMLEDYARAFSFRSICLRYFNAAGADPDGELGEAHEPEPHFIPIALRAAAQGGEVPVNGNDYPTHDGTCIRDFVHVDDLARAHTLALHALLDGGLSGPFNLGTGQGTSLLQTVEAVQRVTGRPLETRFGPRRPGDPAYAVADARRAGRILGWAPRFTRIEDMISHAWQWMLKQAPSADATARLAERECPVEKTL